jgi:hypothetical protein
MLMPGPLTGADMADKLMPARHVQLHFVRLSERWLTEATNNAPCQDLEKSSSSKCERSPAKESCITKLGIEVGI